MKIGTYLTQALINQLAISLTNKETWNHFRGVIERLDDKQVSGTEKKRLAVQELQGLVTGIASWLFNILIELAVTYLRTNRN